MDVSDWTDQATELEQLQRDQALALGLWLWLGLGIGQGPGSGWMHAKLVLVVLVIGYHHSCGVMLRKFEQGTNRRSHIFYRWFNEIPVILLVAAVVLVALAKIAALQLDLETEAQESEQLIAQEKLKVMKWEQDRGEMVTSRYGRSGTQKEKGRQAPAAEKGN